MQTHLPSIKPQTTELEQTGLGWDRRFRHANITTEASKPQAQDAVHLETAMSPGAKERKMLKKSAKNIAR